jgi:YceI-like domain
MATFVVLLKHQKIMILKKLPGILLLALGLLGSCKKDKHSTIVYELHSNESVAEWKGYLKTGYFNSGAIGVSSTSLKTVDGKVVSGSFALPLITLVNYNLEKPAEKLELINHLKTADFFNIALYPEITFEITNVTPASTGGNFNVTGNLSMVGKSLPVTFPATITISDKRITVDANLKVDRTKWGINFAASAELPDDKRIMPEIDIHLQLLGKER